MNRVIDQTINENGRIINKNGRILFRLKANRTKNSVFMLYATLFQCLQVFWSPGKKKNLPQVKKKADIRIS